MTDRNDPYPNKGRASGYTTDQGLTIGEDLVNKITGIIAAHQTKALVESTETRKLIAGIAEQGDTIERVLSDERQKTHAALTSFQKHLDARLDARDQEFDQFQEEARAAWEVSGKEIKKMSGDILFLRQGYESNAANITKLTGQFAEYIKGNRRAELDAILATQREHDLEIRGIKEFFGTLLSPEESAVNADTAATNAAELRELLNLLRVYGPELLTWMREYRAERGGDGPG